MKSASSRIAISFLLSALLPMIGGLTVVWYVPSRQESWVWHSEPLHSTIESVGGISALVLGILLILVARQKGRLRPHLWIAGALVAKGTLDLFHASLGPALPFVWLRCVSTLMGGALFACSWLPERFVNPKRLYALPVVAACGAVGLALMALSFSDPRPVTMQEEVFDPLARAFNLLGGLLYLTASVCFLKRYRQYGQTDDVLWLNVSLLFGVSALMFSPALHWTYAWWFWHLMRLIAWLLCLGYFFAEYARAEADVRRAHDELSAEASQRKRAEQKIQEQNRFLKTIIESLAYPFYVIDATDYTIKIANSAAMAGKEIDEATTCYRLTHEVEQPCAGMRHPCPLERVKETGQPICVEHVHRDQQGVRYMEMHAFPIVDGSGSVVQIIEYGVDITDRKKHEKEREQLIGELANKNAELERFTYTVSHDLKSPLITIKGFLGYLEKDLISGNLERLRSDMARIHGAVEKMSRLLDELLELSRIGRIVNPPQDVPMEDLVRSALETLAGRIAEREVTVLVPTDLPVLYGDAARLREVVENLLDNAVKFMGGQLHPRVEIDVHRDGDMHVICIRDNGIGIEDPYQSKIFQLFERLDQNFEGTGIGLAVVKRIVEVHGGQIWVQSRGVGQGSSFCFTLPKRKQSRAEPE